YGAELRAPDVGGPSPYIVTRYVPGRTLDDLVREHGPLSGAALVRLATGLAAAIAAIHAAGVVHRDLKPGNVMIVDGQPVVIDFGIAHIPDATRLTQTGMVMGTPGYLAPEVIEGQLSSGASDVHSWGATVTFAAPGRQPYGTGNFQAIFFRVLEGKAELAGLPAPLLPLVTLALATDPQARPPAQWLAEQCAGLRLADGPAGAGAKGTPPAAAAAGRGDGRGGGPPGAAGGGGGGGRGGGPVRPARVWPPRPRPPAPAPAA